MNVVSYVTPRPASYDSRTIEQLANWTGRAEPGRRTEHLTRLYMYVSSSKGILYSLDPQAQCPLYCVMRLYYYDLFSLLCYHYYYMLYNGDIGASHNQRLVVVESHYIVVVVTTVHTAAVFLFYPITSLSRQRYHVINYTRVLQSLPAVSTFELHFWQFKR